MCSSERLSTVTGIGRTASNIYCGLTAIALVVAHKDKFPPSSVPKINRGAMFGDAFVRNTFGTG